MLKKSLLLLVLLSIPVLGCGPNRETTTTAPPADIPTQAEIDAQNSHYMDDSADRSR